MVTFIDLFPVLINKYIKINVFSEGRARLREKSGCVWNM